jgi:hypothetical protein
MKPLNPGWVHPITQSPQERFSAIGPTQLEYSVRGGGVGHHDEDAAGVEGCANAFRRAVRMRENSFRRKFDTYVRSNLLEAAIKFS